LEEFKFSPCFFSGVVGGVGGGLKGGGTGGSGGTHMERR